MWITDYKRFWQHAFKFSGTTSRGEFWRVFLINLAIELLLQIPQNIRAFDYKQHPTARIGTGNPHLNHWLFAGGDNSVITNAFLGIALLFLLVTLIPKLALTIRRFHDFNWSAGWPIAFWTSRFLITSVIIFKLIQVIEHIKQKQMTAATYNMMTILIAASVFLLVQLIELILLAKRGKQPNRFTTSSTNPQN
ncbi:DUF805 domain-containing protein [Furfurilactobacillus curtus]|uniref:DUF805 domain-containing protein n=1 Tax=Furfurilactobacillus curtus TaxID=1746200 RepID=A0ABQ5JT18_9LACO